MNGYAGDVHVSAAWVQLSSVKSSFLIDVRTAAEWAFVGAPDLSSISKQTIFVEWQSYPTMGISADFIPRVKNGVTLSGGDEESELYFICRSGVRSQGAAAALTAEGYKKCFNVAGGFEGSHDASGHRGNVDGWKAENLPWTQN